MNDSPHHPAQPLPGKVAPAVHKLAAALLHDLDAGDFDRSRTALRLSPPAVARAALVHLGVDYLNGVKRCAAARLDGRRGAEATAAFINEELRPVIARAARPPAAAQPEKYSLRRRLARCAATLALATAAVIGGSSISLAVFESSAPTMDTLTAPIVDMSPLLDDFSQTALGRDMLAMAAAHNIAIEYDPSLGASTAAGVYSASGKKVRMDPSQPMPEQVMYLAHELRHAWQDIVLGYGEMENRLLTPQQQWTLRRYLEADAFAFSAYFMARRMAELPHAPLPGGNREMGSARKLHVEFYSPDGLTHDEYRRFALERMFTFLGSYDERHLDLAVRSNEVLGDNVQAAETQLSEGNPQDAYQILQALGQLMRSTPSHEVFAEYLRRFGGMSLEPAAETSLQAAAAQSAEVALRAETAAVTPAPHAPDGRSKNDDIAARLAAAERIHQEFRALAVELTADARAGLRGPLRSMPAATEATQVQDTSAQRLHGDGCRLHSRSGRKTAPEPR
jgi:hypothetical protein